MGGVGVELSGYNMESLTMDHSGQHVLGETLIHCPSTLKTSFY